MRREPLRSAGRPHHRTHRDPWAATGQLFAPERIRTRTRDWGGHGLDERITRAWKPFVDWSERWLTIRASEGPESVEAVYREVLAGTTAPDSAHTLSMWPG